MTGELQTILADIKEQILYLQELGIEDFGAELPEYDAANFQVQKSSRPAGETVSAAPPPIERFVPADDLIEAVIQKSAVASPKEEEKRETSSSRRILLEQTRLSRFVQTPKKQTYFSTNQEQREKPEMPKKPVEIIPQETLFGDISQALPESNETFEDIHNDIGNCTRCPLHAGRTKIVHSTGNPAAKLMFIGEAPGADEDVQGAPFVGRAGQLLTKIIEAIGLQREDVFIGNINRCRPPGNRTPTLEEATTCKPFLLREIAIVRPKVIVVLGNTACQNLLETKVGITKIRGEFQDYFGIKVMPTFHPAYLLRDPRKKREVWEDMKKVRDELNKMQ